MDQNQINQRKLQLDNFVQESFSVNVDFAHRLGLDNPHEILMSFEVLEHFVFHTVDAFMKNLAIDRDDRVWIITRIGYLLGEYFKEKYAGYWTVNENSNSPHFGKYVIFAPSPAQKGHYPIDVFGAAADFIDQKGERALRLFIHEIEAELN